jgi:uncharacterized membrane protein YkvA (DUF1232 family)
MGKFNFEDAKKSAQSVAGNRERLQKLYKDVSKKLAGSSLSGEKFNNFKSDIETFQRMIHAYWLGTYKEIPWKSLLLIVAGLIYFINPFDLVPDFIPVAGYIDDISLVIWIFKSISKDIIQFQEWEKSHSEVVKSSM